MRQYFSDTLKKLRKEQGLSQQALANKLHITKTSISRWESGQRQPDIDMISRIAKALGVDVYVLLSTAAQSQKRTNVIMVDDRKLILVGGLAILEQVMPYATLTGFTDANEAIAYAKENRVDLAFLDIELRNITGLELCSRLLAIHPHTNVVYLTAYSEYSLDAWSTGASGFMLKPITPEGVRKQLEHLRYPIWMGGEEHE